MKPSSKRMILFATVLILLGGLCFLGLISNAAAKSSGIVKPLSIMNQYGYDASKWTWSNYRALACAAAYSDMPEEFREVAAEPGFIVIGKSNMNDGVTGMLLIDFYCENGIHEIGVYPTGYKAEPVPSALYYIDVDPARASNADIHYTVTRLDFENALQTIKSGWTWSLEGSTLTISGTGDMLDYRAYDPPWINKNYTITKVIVEDGITSIGDYAFYFMNSSKRTLLKTVILPDTITRIGRSAFYDCENMELDHLPANLTEVGDYGLYSCDKLILNRLPKKLTSVGNHAFAFNNGITCKVPALSSIGEGAFYACRGITGVEFAPGLSSIPKNAFNSCSAITGISLRGVTSIGSYAFQSCDSIKSITFGEKLTSIGEYAFAFGCDSMTSLTLPTSLTSLGSNAFYCCRNLSKVTMSRKTRIGQDAFTDCSPNLKITYYSDNYQHIDISIPEGVTHIYSETFANISYALTVYIPASVISIEDNAFDGIPGLVICGETGSEAEAFAERKGYEFIVRKR